MAKVDLNSVLENHCKPNTIYDQSPTDDIPTTGAVVQGTVNKKNTSFFGPKLKEAAKYAGTSIILPYLKDMAFNSVQSMLSMLIYKEDRTRKSGLFGNTFSGWTNYAGGSLLGANTTQFVNNTLNNPSLMQNRTGVYDTGSIMFGSRGDCNKVLNRLTDICESVGYARVSDFYVASGITTYDFTANNFGWDKKAIDSAQVSVIGTSYSIIMPTPSQLR